MAGKKPGSSYDPAPVEQKWYPVLGETGLFHGGCEVRETKVFYRNSSAERHGFAAHGARPPAHPA